jgi:hypothetical protein
VVPLVYDKHLRPGSKKIRVEGRKDQQEEMRGEGEVTERN